MVLEKIDFVQGGTQGKPLSLRHTPKGVYAAAGRMRLEEAPKRIAEVAHTKIEIRCPICERIGTPRLLQLVDSKTIGVIYPYCKKCCANIPIDLDGEGNVRQAGEPFKYKEAK